MPEAAGRILIAAPNWLGDAVMALPAIADVRRSYPDRHLVVAARAPVAPLFRMVPGVDAIAEITWRGRPRELRRMRQDAAALRALGAEIAILLPNSFASAWLMKSAGVPERWGYAADARNVLLTRAVSRPSRSVHQGVYYQHLVRELGMANGPLEPRIAVPADALAEERALLAAAGLDPARPLVVCAPGAAYGSAKRWPPEHFVRLIDALVSGGACCALVGSSADAETTASIAAGLAPAARAHVVDLAGRTSLAALAGVLSLARACVSNDSGAMHVAAAVGVPLAAIFGPTNEHETSPLPHAGVRTELVINAVSCRPCMLRECPIEHPCMRDLAPERVLEVVHKLLHP